MLLAAVILFWVLLGVAVFLIAQSGGVRGAQKRLTESSGRKAAVLWLIGGVLLYAGFGIAIPAVVTADGVDRNLYVKGGIHLTENQREGRVLFQEHCGFCHTLAASKSVGNVGPNFDVLRPPKALVLNAIEYGRSRGKGDMPYSIVQGKEAQQVADYVSTVAGR